MAFASTSLESLASEVNQLGGEGDRLAASLQVFGARVRGLIIDTAVLLRRLRESRAWFDVAHVAMQWENLPDGFVFPNRKEVGIDPYRMDASQLTKQQIAALLDRVDEILAAAAPEELKPIYAAAGGPDTTIV